ncbi:MAG: hypothetical protein ACI9F9_001816 [Candidatus Paceibacteria bacterium]|jgi:hypothetical protein
MLRLTLIALFSLVALSPESLTQQPEGARVTSEPSSLDVLASQFSGSAKDHVAIDVDGAGRTVAVWQSRRQQQGTYGIYARRFDADGTPLGDEVRINQTVEGHQTSPAVSLDEDGSAWFAWSSFGQDGDQGTIVVRRFDAALQTSGPERIANELHVGDQHSPSIDSDGKGNAFVIWEHQASMDGPGRIHGRRLLASGELSTLPELELDHAAGANDKSASLSMSRDGGTAVVWARLDKHGRPAGVFGRRFDTDGVGGPEWRASPAAAKGAIEPVLSSVDVNHCVLLWLDGSGGEYGVQFRRLRWSTDGTLQRGEVHSLPRAETGYVSGATLSAREDGGLALAWNVYSRGSEHHADVFLTVYDVHDRCTREPFIGTAESANSQHIAPADGTRCLVFGAQGALTLGWSGDGGLGDHKGAHLSLHAAPGTSLAASGIPVEPSLTFATPAIPHQPPSFAPPSGALDVDRTAVTHPLTTTIGFPGIMNTGWTPPDPDLAVGPNHVVQMTNGAIAFFDKAGNLLFQDAIEGSNGFWGNQGATNFVFDPEPRYDPHTDRFFVMANERGSDDKPYFLLAVSDDSNPVGSWHKYRINVESEAGDTDIDSPNMGIDSQAVYLTADFFGPTKFLVFIIEKAPLLSGGAIQSTSLLINGKQSMGLPVSYGSPARQYMLWAPETASANHLEVFAIHDPLGTPSLVSTTISVPTYSQPENPPQLGSSVRPETFEARIWSCVYRDGSLWATHHMGAARIRQRWYEIDMANWPVSGTPSLLQSGTINPEPTVRSFFGSIAVDAAGNMGLAFSRSSPTEYISMGIAYRAASDPLGTTRPMIIAKTSTSADTSGRWGDYSGIGVDPSVPGEFWGAAEYRTNSWRTWIQSFQVEGPVQSYCSTSPNSAGAGALLSSGGSVSFTANDFSLVASAAPSTVQGLFFFGFIETQVPFGNGFRCVDGAIQRLPVTATDGFGAALHALDLNGSHVGGAIVAGTTAKFQYWYRDPGVGQDFNLSDALSVTFAP